MLCRCKNIDFLPSIFCIGRVYHWRWLDCDHNYVCVRYDYLLMSYKKMTRDVFLHCFEVV